MAEESQSLGAVCDRAIDASATCQYAWPPDDDLDLNNLPDDELEAYFNKLVPPATQRGRVEGQEIPVTVRFPFLFTSVRFF